MRPKAGEEARNPNPQREDVSGYVPTSSRQLLSPSTYFRPHPSAWPAAAVPAGGSDGGAFVAGTAVVEPRDEEDVSDGDGECPPDRRRVRWAVAALAVAAVPWLVLPGAAGAAKRVAPVIGNNKYENARPLRNPGNDAMDVGTALGRLGFEVKHLANAGHAELLQGLRDSRWAASVSECQRPAGRPCSCEARGPSACRYPAKAPQRLCRRWRIILPWAHKFPTRRTPGRCTKVADAHRRVDPVRLALGPLQD